MTALKVQIHSSVPPAVRQLLDREGTGISWAHLTFNPWIGCQKVSPACRLCYAETLATSRLRVEWGPGAQRRRTAASTWKHPLRWNRIAGKHGVSLRVFCASLADWADNAVPDEWRADLAQIIRATPWLDWMLLTKRVRNAGKMLEAMFPEGVPSNVWLGVTICNQDEAERDMGWAVELKHRFNLTALFVSAEPLLGPLDLSCWMPWLDLIICGGESGKDAAPSHPDWFRGLLAQTERCASLFHFKQWGEWALASEHVDASRILPPSRQFRFADQAHMVRVGTIKAGRMLDGHIHDGGLWK